MLSGPANDYFGDAHHLRGGFPTPNESGLRTGLTPGGSGSMFPAASPNTQALYSQLASGGATPSTLDFHRTAISAASKRDQTTSQQQHPGQQQQPHQTVTSRPQDSTNGSTTVKSEPKSASGPFDPHDNDAANGLFMLAQGAQGRNGAPNNNQFAVPSGTASHGHPAPSQAHMSNTSPQLSNVNGGSARGMSEGSNMSDDSEQTRPNTRGKNNKKAATNGRRKASEPPAKAPPNKKAKTNGGMPSGMSMGSMEPSDDEDEDDERINEDGTKTKMTDEEKRKNFLERNRYVSANPASHLHRLTKPASPLSSVVSARSSGSPTCRPRLKCSVVRTMLLHLRSHNYGRKWSTSRRFSLPIRTAQSRSSRVCTVSCLRLWSRTTRK